ncbi:MAG: SHD1 domain-containing protein [Thermoguttaceae bacterium]
MALAVWGRTWTDVASSRQFEADFVDCQGDLVWLKPADGPTFSIRLGELSQADRQYVAELLRQEKAQRRLARPDDPNAIPYGRGREVCKLAVAALEECSGIACSRRHGGLFWAHNDSGDAARLYLFDRRGRDLGFCRLAGVFAYDWEDLASFSAEGKHYLLVADTGNNAINAPVHMLYLIEEPACDPHRGVLVQEVPVLKTIYFSYEDDFRNCEAMAVDPTDRTIVLVSKERSSSCHVYALKWPSDQETPKPPKLPRRPQVARLIGTLQLRQVTGMDISPDGCRAIVLTSSYVYQYTRGPKEDWQAGFSRPPREIPLPKLAQAEAVCFGPDGKTIYVSSEKRPTPLVEIPVQAPTRAP